MKLSILVLIVIQVIMIAHTVAENASNRNTSLLFDGVDDYVRVNDSAILNFAKESFTVAVWAKSGKNNRMLLDKGRTASPYLGYSITYGGITNDLISFSVRDGIPNTSTATSTTGLGGNEWLHVVGVRDASAGKVRIYINGVLEDEQDDLTGNLSNKQVLSIGSNSNRTLELSSKDMCVMSASTTVLYP